MRKSGPGRWWGPREGSGVSEREGTSWKGRMLTGLQGSEICGASPRGGLTPPPPPCHPRPELRRRRQHNPLLLCLCSRSAETADQEVSSAPLHSRPDPRPASSQDPESPPIPATPPVWPCPSSGRTAVPQSWCALGGGVPGKEQGSAPHPRTSPHAPRPFRVDRLGGGLQDKTPPTSLRKTHPHPSLPQFPSRKKDGLKEPVVGSETVCASGRGELACFPGPRTPFLLPSTFWPERGPPGGRGRKITTTDGGA